MLGYAVYKFGRRVYLDKITEEFWHIMKVFRTKEEAQEYICENTIQYEPLYPVYQIVEGGLGKFWEDLLNEFK